VQDKVGDDGVALGRQRELGSRRGELATVDKARRGSTPLRELLGLRTAEAAGSRGHDKLLSVYTGCLAGLHALHA
jgi:hypothetical protein